ncbi:acylamino-acid-releasing enzyme isoform X2 [Larimichthys crocea]|uniref:acylamino-acid-releasing enzyme isoform X2 n=1 Tax=Larimichthys crocea TaxID=215358 RepID=UPI00090149D7|nr:acylamino-acid-releasing enzyme isoform X2 [Larimichthys crocea]
MEADTQMDLGQINGVYGEVGGLPTPVAAHVSEEQLPELRIYTVSAEWSQRDPVRGSRLHFSQQWTVIADSNNHKSIKTVLPPGPCVHVCAELLTALSPIRGLRALIRETCGHQLLEIWDHYGLRKCLNLTALDKHGRVYDDAQFGCLSWSDCENRLLYVAEKNKFMETNDGESLCGKDRRVYCEDWGEGLSNKSVAVICVVNLQNGHINVLQGVPPDVSPGQALWACSSQSVIFVGWYHEPFRLGLKFCSNRRSALFKLDMDGNCECLSGDNVSVSCPRLSPDGSTLIYRQGRVFGPHSQCLSLQQLDLRSGKTSTLLDVVDRPQAGEFAGVYEALPSSCWSEDSQRVVFSSPRRNWKDLFMVDRRSSKVTSLSDSLSALPRLYGSWKLLTIQNDLMVVCCSSPNIPPTLLVGFLPLAGEAVTWRTLQPPIRTFDFHWTVLDVTPPPEEDNTHYSGLDFGAILVKPSRYLHEAKIPLVVYIHGGPHSQFPVEWNCTTAGLAKLGFAVLMVNYRGSTGFGQDSILSLISHIGSQDVKDVQRAVLTALQTDNTLDPKRLAVIGGSHGGFLSCHLVGQYPEFYRACAARNPVINAATLLGTSDIVDCSMGFQYSYDQIPTAEALAAMLEKSPIIHAAQIKAPVLLMLGGRDKRVSPHQGLELYKALKSRALPVRLLWFPDDGHSLSRVDTQADCFLNTVLWMQQHV